MAGEEINGVDGVDQELVRQGIHPERLLSLLRGAAPTGAGSQPAQPSANPLSFAAAPKPAAAGDLSAAMPKDKPLSFTQPTAQPSAPAAAGNPADPSVQGAPKPSFTKRYDDELSRGQQEITEKENAVTAAGDYKPSIGRKLLAIGQAFLTGIPSARNTWNPERAKAQDDLEGTSENNTARLAAIKTEAGIADTESQSNQRDALAEKALREPPAKEPQPKIAYHYTNKEGKEVSVFEDGRELAGGEVEPKPPPPDAGKLAGEIEAQVGPKPVGDPKNPGAPVQYNGKTYRSERAAQAAWGHAAEQIKSREAAAGADARGKAYGQNRPTQVLDTWNQNRPIVVSARDAEENPQRYVTQTAGVKALSGKVTIDDIRGALENLKATTKVLDKGGDLNRAAIATVLADPKSTAANFLQSEVAGKLNADEQDYVIALLTAREVIPGIRNLLGTGQATESRVKNMLDTLPSAKTPDSNYANKQIESSLATLRRVGPAIPDISPSGNGNSKGTGNLPPGWK